MKTVLRQPLAALGLTAAGLALVLIYSTLLHQVGRMDDLLRYPRSERLSPARLSWANSTTFHVTQHAAYRTGDDLAQVYGWYARYLNPDQHEPPAAQPDCLVLTRLSEYLFLCHALAVHICARSGLTLIFVQHSLALRPP